jgi:hypothetical protein
MKINKAEVSIETSGTMKSGAFGFKWSAEMSDLLSRSIYTDPILAVVREYTCNAVDAHKAINSTRAIDIHCSTGLEPHWSVRDYGPGLSQVQVMGDDSASGLFNSFGMGSKAGFAYGEAFNVISWHAGTQKTYVCHKGSKGIPEVTLVNTAVSTEPTGIEIKIPVKRDDIKKFADNTSRIVSYMSEEFRVTPSTVPSSKVVYSLKGTCWGLCDPDPDNYRPCVVMGGVAYPIEFSKLAGIADIHHVLHRMLRFFLNVGDIELSVSREGLLYDDRTIEVLTDCFEVFREEYVTHVKMSVASQETYWTACALANTHMSYNYASSTLTRKDVLWNGEHTYDTIYLYHRKPYYTPGYAVHNKVYVAGDPNTRYFKLSVDEPYEERRRYVYNTDFALAATPAVLKYVIVYNDINKPLTAVLKAARERYADNGILVISGSPISLARAIIAFRRDIPWVKASELTYTRNIQTRKPRSSTSGTLKVLRRNAPWYSGRTPHKHLHTVQFDYKTTTPTYYVYTHAGEYYADDTLLYKINLKRYHYNLAELETHLNTNNDIDTYIVPLAKAKHVKANPNMISPILEVVKLLEPHKNESAKLFSAGRVDPRERDWYYDRLYGGLDALGVCTDMVKAGRAAYAQETVELTRLKHLYSMLNYLRTVCLSPMTYTDAHWYLRTPADIPRFYGDKTGILDKYPLLSVLDLAKIQDNGLSSHLKLYINSVDEMKGNENGTVALHCAA